MDTFGSCRGSWQGCYFIVLPVYRQVQWHDTLDLPIGRTAFTDKALFYKFQWMAQHTHPLDGFFNDSALTLYLSLQNPTPTEFVTYDETTRPEQMAAVVEAFKRNPPAYIALFPLTSDLQLAEIIRRPSVNSFTTITAWPKSLPRSSPNTNKNSGDVQQLRQRSGKDVKAADAGTSCSVRAFSRYEIQLRLSITVVQLIRLQPPVLALFAKPSFFRSLFTRAIVSFAQHGFSRTGDLRI